MILADHQPSPPLNHFIDTMWFFDGYDMDHTMERLLPDATMEPCRSGIALRKR